MRKGSVIAIDGPVASGKGTIAHKLAQQIHAVNINTGGIWRAYTYMLLSENEVPSLTTLDRLRTMNVSLDVRDDGSFDVLLNGTIITDQLTHPEISKAVSKFGTNNQFAEFIISESRRVGQQYIDQGRTIIMEGRQIGTIVFPDASVKIFLTASIDVRAKRRQAQYEKKGIIKSLEDVRMETQQRDEQDMNREIGALPRKPELLGYDILDNSDMDENTTLDAILDILVQKNIWQKN